MTRVLPTLFAITLLVAFAQPVGNADIGFHLRIGDHILRTFRVPEIDLWSWTAFGAPYLDQEWLSQVLYALAERAGGTEGVALLAAGAIAGAFLVLMAAMPGGIGLRIALLLPVAYLASSHAMARPHVLGWLLLALFLRALRKGGAWAPFLLLALWANCHASFVLGAGLGVLHFLGKRQWRWAAAMALAPLLNPSGWKLYGFFMSIRDLPLDLIGEFQPLEPESPFLWVWVAFLLLLAWGLVLARRFRPLELSGVAALAALGFSGMRYPMVSALALSPLLAELWAPRIRETRASLALVAALLVAGTGWRLHRGAGRLGLDEQALPVRAAAFLMESGVEGPLFNDYNFGGTLLWKAWPRFPVSIDGRMDVYRGRPLTNCRKALSGDPAWREALAGARAVLVRTDRPLVRVLDRDPDWEALYFDQNAAVFIRRGDCPSVRRLIHVTPTRGPGRPGDAAEIRGRIGELAYLLSWSPGFEQGRRALEALRARLYTPPPP